MILALPGKRSTTFKPNTDTLQSTIEEKYEFCHQFVTLLILQCNSGLDQSYFKPGVGCILL